MVGLVFQNRDGASANRKTGLTMFFAPPRRWPIACRKEQLKRQAIRPNHHAVTKPRDGYSIKASTPARIFVRANDTRLGLGFTYLPSIRRVAFNQI